MKVFFEERNKKLFTTICSTRLFSSWVSSVHLFNPLPQDKFRILVLALGRLCCIHLFSYYHKTFLVETFNIERELLSKPSLPGGSMWAKMGVRSFFHKLELVKWKLWECSLFRKQIEKLNKGVLSDE